MQLALLLDEGDRRVVLPNRLFPQALHPSKLEGGEMVTGEVSDEVCRADDQRSIVSELHHPTVAADRVSLPVAVALACGHESAATGCRGPAAVGQDVGEPGR